MRSLNAYLAPATSWGHFICSDYLAIGAGGSETLVDYVSPT
jgi:hypothetical protein